MQKIWTVMTISLLEYCIRASGLKGEIIGQGDNQAIIFELDNVSPLLTPEESVKLHGEVYQAQIDGFKKILYEEVRKAGHVLKLEETWASTEVFLYGKDPSVKGAKYANVLKRASRIYDDTNDIIPTLDNRIATIYTSGHSTANKGYSWIIPYLHAFVEAYRVIDSTLENFLKKHSSRKNMSPLRRNDISYVLALMPSSLGGLPNLPWTDFIFRGHPDPLTSSLAALQELRTKTSDAIVAYAIKSYAIPKRNKSLVGLVEDPTGIPTDGGEKVTLTVKECIREAIETYTVNRDIRDLLTASADSEIDKCKSWLTTMEPPFPRLMNELYSMSPAGAGDRFIGVFGSISTLKNLIGMDGGENIMPRINRAEERRLNKLIIMADKVLRLRDQDNFARIEGCATKIARVM